MSEIKIKNENENEINTEINSSFEKLNDNCLANLKILSALQIGQKLSFSEGKFFIDVDSYATSGARWWNNESWFMIDNLNFLVKLDTAMPYLVR